MDNSPPHPLVDSGVTDSVAAHSDAAGGASLLAAGCRQLGIELTDAALSQFERYYRELVEWNARLNLTSITEYDDVQTKHFLDSLVSLPLIAGELGKPLPLPALRVLDVGTGAGFPGIPLKLASPALQLTLMDGTQKKIAFLEHLLSVLEIKGVSLVHGRAEEMGRSSAHRERYDLVVARAVAPLNVLVEYLLPLVIKSGLAVIYKGPSAPEEFMEARRAIKLLGGDAVRLAPVEVPFLDERRFVLLLKKIAPTPAQYPRGQGLPRKRPIV